MFNVEDYQKYYSNLEDEKLILIAKNDTQGMKHEAVQILKNEIQERGLGKDLLDWVEAETDSFSKEEIQSLIAEIIHSPCPKCHEINRELIAYRIPILMGIVIFSRRSSDYHILCESCGLKAKLKSFFCCLFFGWWSRSTFLYTPNYLVRNFLDLFRAKKLSLKFLQKLITENTGNIRSSYDENFIGYFISEHNKSVKFELFKSDFKVDPS